MRDWSPQATVATVVELEGRYLLVEERDKTSGALVFNQPAGHLEAGESLVDAAFRETLEETRWEVGLSGLLGIALYTAPTGTSYLRTTFLATPVREIESASLDPDIHAVHWLDYDEILEQSARMRSPLVLAAIEQYRRGICYPLDLLYSA